MEPTCPKCHTVVRTTDYFCFNCGTNLRPAPPPTDAGSQFMLYLGSVFIPPFGILWGWKYLRSEDSKAKIVGYVACILTIISLIIGMIWVRNLMASVTSQVNQFQSIQGL
jgi:hypothetical protein